LLDVLSRLQIWTDRGDAVLRDRAEAQHRETRRARRNRLREARDVRVRVADEPMAEVRRCHDGAILAQTRGTRLRLEAIRVALRQSHVPMMLAVLRVALD